MRTSPLAPSFAILVALGATTDAAAAPPDPHPGPPAEALDLDVRGQLEVGGNANLLVVGAPPGTEVRFYGTADGQGPGPCSPTYATCLDLRPRVHLLGTTVSDAHGRAWLHVPVPASIEGLQVWMQAIVVLPGGSTPTDVETAVVRSADTGD